jgi:hypothetical protein
MVCSLSGPGDYNLANTRGYGQESGTYLIEAKVPEQVPALVANVECPIIHAIIAACARVHFAEVSDKAPAI